VLQSIKFSRRMPIPRDSMDRVPILHLRGRIGMVAHTVHLAFPMDPFPVYDTYIHTYILLNFTEKLRASYSEILNIAHFYGLI